MCNFVKKNSMSKRILVIAPHADDEVLGCGGYLLHESAKGSEIHIAIGTIGGKDRRQEFSVRIREFEKVCNILKAKGEYLFWNKDAELDTVAAFEITSKIDKLIDEIKPDEIFAPYRSRHQDHIKLYECVMASLRLREGYMPKLVALYEYPFISDNEEIRGGLLYHNISDNINEKIKLFRCYKSQIKKRPSPLNGEAIKSLAMFRGMSIGSKYAELFYVQKMVL